MTRVVRISLSLVLGMALVLVPAGCGGLLGGSLPDELTLTLPDGTTQTVTQGAGVPSLADSKWQFSQSFSNGQTVEFLIISFGPEGNLDRFDANTIAPDIFGETILFDGERHQTDQFGLSYQAATYGAETSDASGFAFEGRLTAFAAGVTAATATAVASGAFARDDPDTMTGTFSITTEVSITSIPEANIDETFQFIAHRVE